MKFVLSIVCLLIGVNLFGQSQPLLQSVASNADFFTTDKLGNLYLVEGDEIILYNAKGKELYRYSDKSLGEIASLDANNALKLVVFYKDQSLIAILDNTLSVHGSAIELADKNFDQVVLVCRSQRENLWLYDQQNMEIIQTDINLQVIARSGNLQQALGQTINPTYITEQNNMLYMANPESGIFVFDNFGTYLKTIPIITEEFQVRGNYLFYKEDGMPKRYDMKRFDFQELQLPRSDFERFQVQENRLYLQTRAGVDIYSEN